MTRTILPHPVRAAFQPGIDMPRKRALANASGVR